MKKRWAVIFLHTDQVDEPDALTNVQFYKTKLGAALSIYFWLATNPDGGTVKMMNVGVVK